MNRRVELPTLWLVIPCYNEKDVLPHTAPLFLGELDSMRENGLIAPNSTVCFVDDGSIDGTWSIIEKLAATNAAFKGIRLSRNRGHQNALLCGLMEASEQCDIAVSIDCDGQDDISAMTEMVREYHAGAEIVYGVRSSRATDSFLKRFTCI